VGLRNMRKHWIWYTNGMPRSRELRQKLFALETLDEVKQALSEYLLQIKKEYQTI